MLQSDCVPGTPSGGAAAASTPVPNSANILPDPSASGLSSHEREEQKAASFERLAEMFFLDKNVEMATTYALKVGITFVCVCVHPTRFVIATYTGVI